MYKVKIKISQEELDILYLPKRLSALEVAKKIRLPQKANILSKIDLELTPYLKYPISLIGNTQVQWVFIIKPTQSGGTVFLQVAIADSIDQDPGTLIYINPDETLTKKNMKEKVINMIDETPDLAKHKIGIKKTSKTGIELDNMSIYPGWAGSLGTLSSVAAKRVILDELRLMKLMIGDESNALKLAGDRLTTYLHMGLGQGFGVSTPSVEGDLLHQQLTVPGTLVLKWHIKCDNCGKTQVLDFFRNKKIVNITDADGSTREVYKCVCLECGYEFNDSDQKKKLNSTGFYAVEGGSLELPQKLPKRVLCWFDSMVSPFRSFQAMWEEFKQTKDKLHDYKNFWQCWLAKFWIDDISKTSVEKLEEHKIEDACGVVPEWCKVLTGGIDSQKAGFYVTIRAWGENRITRLVDAYFLECRLPTSHASDVRRIIKRDVTDRIFTTLKGDKWKLGLYAIDTGGNRTKQIYEGTAGLERIIWVKGRDNQNLTISFNKEIGLYLVRTVEYLDETEEKSFSESFELPYDVPKEYLRQWVNLRKTRKINRNTNEMTFIWKHVGQFDYRMADIHSFICLDITTSVGTFRRELEKPDFFFNPLIRKIEDEAMSVQETMDSEDSENYEVGTFSEEW